jgi:hypothetical protein
MKFCCVALALTLLAAFVSDSWGQPSEAPKQTPEVKAEQKLDSGLKPEQPAERNQHTPSPALAAIPEVLSDGTNRKCGTHCNDGEQEGTEFWPLFFGYRLKVTDTLVAAFTALLFIATFALWWSTRRLVKGADKTAERQLRAYVLVKNITISGVVEGGTPQAEIILENSGQTPAYDVKNWVAIGFIDYPPKSMPQDDDDGSAAASVTILGPHGQHRMLGKLKGVFTFPDVVALNSGARAIHIVGGMTYRDAFGVMRRTIFNCFYGGEFGVNAEGAPFHATNGNEAD